MVDEPSPGRKAYPFRYDAIVKDLFQRDQPSILARCVGDRKIRGFLNIEFAIVEERIADLLVELDDGTIVHIEFQSDNQSAMPLRMGIYGLLVAEKYRGRNLEQVVIYLGPETMTMPDSAEIGGITVRYKLMDIREFRVEDLLATGSPGDCALALLARGGVEHLREILEHASRLKEPERRRVFRQMAMLAGLRGAAENFRMEMKAMSPYIDIEENVILKDVYYAGVEQGREQGLEQGLEQGREQGLEQGMAKILRRLVEERFGPLPDWANARIQGASPAEIERWASKVISAPTLEAALGL